MPSETNDANIAPGEVRVSNAQHGAVMMDGNFSAAPSAAIVEKAHCHLTGMGKLN